MFVIPAVLCTDAPSAFLSETKRPLYEAADTKRISSSRKTVCHAFPGRNICFPESTFLDCKIFRLLIFCCLIYYTLTI